MATSINTTQISVERKIEMVKAEVSTEAGYDKIRRFLTDCRQPNYMYNALDKIREGKKIKGGRTLNDLVFFATGMTI